MLAPVTVPLPFPLLKTVSVCAVLAKVAVTAFAAVMAITQEPVPVHAPDQPEKVDPGAAAAVRVTLVPVVYEAAQIDPQDMLGPVTVPLPVPALVTESVCIAVKVAVTALTAVIDNVHDPVPVHAPDHPEKIEPGAAAAVRVTLEPEVYDALQVDPHEMLGPLTVPLPVPALETVRACIATANVAVTVLAADIETTHAPVPVQAPDQPVKTEPVAAAAVSLTLVPALKEALHVDPHVMLGPLTVPLPTFVTVSV